MFFFLTPGWNFAGTSSLIVVGRKWICTNRHPIENYRKFPSRHIELGPGNATLVGLVFRPSPSFRTVDLSFSWSQQLAHGEHER